MFKKLIVLVCFFGLLGMPLTAIAGDARIESVDFDGSCVKIRVSSNENDSSDRFMVRFQVRTGRGKQWGSQKDFRGLTTRTKYMEFCNSKRLRPQHCHVNVQIFHNGRLEDQYQWGGGR